jgi:UDP-N-acetylmuramate: L-alanyl-gamma-D-glutamyl-meso-diaminopimelate ligase
MLAWMLEYAGLKPGFLIGGIPANFGLSARIGETPFFVVEADEYDTAFFDKRSKFVHYHPRTAVLNNLEFDHADIFENLAAIKKQFHHFVRTIPGDGLIVKNGEDENINAVLEQGCWSEVAAFHKNHDPEHSDDDWSIGETSKDGKSFTVLLDGKVVANVNWSLHGLHNRMNALAAIAAAQHAGVPVELSGEALSEFKGIKRRLEVRGLVNGITVYDDFAHHPTAIEETLTAMKEVQGKGKLFAVLEPRSNTMRMGIHKESLSNSWQQADEVCLYQPEGLDWDLNDAVSFSSVPATVFSSTESIIDHVVSYASSGDHILIMSNGGFEAIHQRLLDALIKRYGSATA